MFVLPEVKASSGGVGKMRNTAPTAIVETATITVTVTIVGPCPWLP